MRSMPALAVSMAALVVLAACTSGPAATPAPSSSSGPAAPSTAGLDGRTFIVTAAAGHEVVAGSEISLRFEGGRLGISAGCNQVGGSYEVRDGMLVVGAMMTTEMACDEPLMAQDQWVSAFVNGASVALEGDTLTLAKDGVTLTATDREVVKPDLPLEGTRWAVDGLVSNQAVSSMPMGVEAWLELAGGKVTLNAGCNRGSGTAEVRDGTIVFGPIGTTKMACKDGAMQVETHLLGVLGGEVAYGIEADTLTITGPGGGLTAKGTPSGS